MRISVGKIADIPSNTCVPIGDGHAIVVRVGNEIRAYRNRCAHQDAPLANVTVRDGVITCPVHQWRFQVTDGSHTGSSHKLEPLPVEVFKGDLFVMMPPAGSSRGSERLLSTDRDDTWPHGLSR